MPVFNFVNQFSVLRRSFYMALLSNASMNIALPLSRTLSNESAI